MMNGCRRNDVTEENQLPSDTNQQEETNDNNEVPEETQTVYTIDDYYPLLPDTEYIYEGEGNEYASYWVYTDYLNQVNGRIQTRTNNGGTELARIIQNKDGRLSILLSKEEFYYRDNLLDQELENQEEEVLLMEPLAAGTEWTLADGRRRYINNTDAEVETPVGNFSAIEVITENSDSTVLQYYVRDIGLIRTVFQSSDMEVSSTLSEIKRDATLNQTVELYYANADEKIYPEQKTISFKTNDITRQKIEEALKAPAERENSIPLLSENTKINTMYRGKDNIAYIDLSKEFVEEMNLGSGYEALALQSLTNTVGNYYGTGEVYLTIDQKPYESGHIIMAVGETMKVNMDLIVRE